MYFILQINENRGVLLGHRQLKSKIVCHTEGGKTDKCRK